MLGELDFTLALSQAGQAIFWDLGFPFCKMDAFIFISAPTLRRGVSLDLSRTRRPPPFEYIYLHPHLEGLLIDGRRKDIGKKK